MAFPKPDGIETYHTKPYPAIDITRPELSAAGKVILITGGGSGLGLAFTEHFAKAGSTKIAITGRRANILNQAKSDIESKYPGTQVLTLAGDVSDTKAVHDAFTTTKSTLGPIDVLINNAGYLPHYVPIGSTAKGGLDEWWKGYEVNVKGTYNVLSAFLATAAPQNATVINLSTAGVNAIFSTQSAYGSSKMAATRLFEYFQAEHPEFRVVNVAPGVVRTEMHERTIAAMDDMGVAQLPLDDSKYLPSINHLSFTPIPLCLVHPAKRKNENSFPPSIIPSMGHKSRSSLHKRPLRLGPLGRP